MNKKVSFVALFLLVALLAVDGCVAQRPARNGVFNENQYLRKAFLVRSADDGASDPGWIFKATVTSVSTPDPLGDYFGIFAGAESGGQLVRFMISQDKLQLVNMREMTDVPDDSRTPEIVNAWPVTSVDLKYRINLDGEKTNFFEENQELDWQVRQWVKINFAKNDVSDVAPLGGFTNDLLARCTDIADASATLVPNSFYVDEPANYMQWGVSITLPLKWDDDACLQAYGKLGDLALRLGRQSVTFDLTYSFMRAKAPSEISYKTFELGEKDPIRHKYGPIEYVTVSRDNDSGQLAARELLARFDPEKPIVWYFAKGFPEKYKPVFTGPGGVAEQTNKLFEDAGVASRVSFKNFDDDLPVALDGDGNPVTDDAGNPVRQRPREYGDVRYSFLRWVSDRDMQSYWAGVTQFVSDPRTGETLSSSIAFNDFAIKDYYVQRLDAYLQTIGASASVNSSGDWPDLGACKDGDVAPIVQKTVVANHNGKSSLYQKMQDYLQHPVATYGSLGPQDFIVQHDAADKDFFDAYYALAPYYVFADPDMNPFVIREGGQGVLGPGAIWKLLKDEAEFKTLAAKIDRGEAPYEDVTGPHGLDHATSFLNHFRELTLSHRQLVYRKNFLHRGMHMDSPEAFSFEAVVARDARRCVDGKWETKEQWVAGLIDTYWSQVIWHEFGHALGLEHNFMGSMDERNYPHYQDKSGRDHVALYSNSVMEYNDAPDRVFWHAGWAPYDSAAISWIYANTAPTPLTASDPKPEGISGQISSTKPWKDPKGYRVDGKTEIQFLFCDERHLKYTPFCRQGDLGRTPSEIMANAIDAYEWEYQWRNFRLYRKIWNNADYADSPLAMIQDMRRFLSLWVFDWSTGELADSMRRIGIKNPDPNGSDLEYFTQLTNKFNKEVSTANQMVAAFHKAIIQQSSGERPYRTVYDKFYGDVTQQGIILDKLFAMQGWTALWPTENYDPNQAGSYIASYSGIGDSSYAFVAHDAINSMIGGQYDVYPYFVPLAVAQFAQDTHDPAFSGNPAVRDWIGGHTFTRVEDFLNYFRDLAVQNSFPGCTKIETCDYDPRDISDTHNEFFGPDKRKWIWAYIADRNSWVAVQKERNTASYIIVRNYTDDVIYQQDDGAFPGGAYSVQLPVKFFLDSFNYFN